MNNETNVSDVPTEALIDVVVSNDNGVIVIEIIRGNLTSEIKMDEYNAQLLAMTILGAIGAHRMKKAG